MLSYGTVLIARLEVVFSEKKLINGIFILQIDWNFYFEEKNEKKNEFVRKNTEKSKIGAKMIYGYK